MSEFSPCRVCKAFPDVFHLAEKVYPWIIQCPNSAHHSHKGAGAKIFRTTYSGMKLTWENTQKKPLPSASDSVKRERMALVKRVFCSKCGLSEPHLCLSMSTFRRIGEPQPHYIGASG